jgi:hypothetical protein
VAILVGRLQNEMVGRDVDRRQSTNETALFGARAIDMAFRCAFRKLDNRVSAIFGIAPQSQQHIVVAVENRLHSKKSRPAWSVYWRQPIFVRLVKNAMLVNDMTNNNAASEKFNRQKTMMV